MNINGAPESMENPLNTVGTASAPVERLLNNTLEVNKQLDGQVEKIYGLDYHEISQKLKAWANPWIEERARETKWAYDKGVGVFEWGVDWANKKGLFPLPKSKVGMLKLSKAFGATGAFMPFGLVTLVPLSLVFLKKSKNMRDVDPEEVETNNEINYV